MPAQSREQDTMEDPNGARLAIDSPNALQRFRSLYGAYVAEAFGAGTIILFGAGAQCQTQLYKAGDTTTCAFGKSSC